MLRIVTREPDFPRQRLWPPDQPIVVLLHGFMGNRHDWAEVIAALQNDYQLLVPDLPGHGENLAYESADPLTFAQLAVDLQATIRRHTDVPVNLIGYSMGGRLALYVAAHYPHLVQSLVLESAHPGLIAEDERARRRAWDAQNSATLLSHSLDEFLSYWYNLSLFASLHRQPERVERLLAHRRQNNAVWLARVVRELSPGHQPPLWAPLPKLAMPILLLAGTLDAKYVAVSQQVAAQLPHAQRHIISEAGHNIHLEQPTAFVEAVRRFLQG